MNRSALSDQFAEALPRAWSNPAVDGPLARLRIVLCRPSHPGNIGAAARAMKVMGLHRLTLVGPKRFPDPEADARAAGAVDVLAGARVCDSLEEALAECVYAVALSARRRDLGPPPMTAREAAAHLLARAGAGEAALVFGNETAGLTNEEAQRCDATAMIPANPRFTSLNLGAAVQILCYEARLAVDGQKLPGSGPSADLAGQAASHADIEGLHGHLERVMTDTGFYNPAQPGRLLPKLRRLFAKAALEKEEINILRGLLAATQQPTGHGKK